MAVVLPALTQSTVEPVCVGTGAAGLGVGEPETDDEGVGDLEGEVDGTSGGTDVEDVGLRVGLGGAGVCEPEGEGGTKKGDDEAEGAMG